MGLTELSGILFVQIRFNYFILHKINKYLKMYFDSNVHGLAM